MDENVAKAVEEFDAYINYVFGEYPAGEQAWQTIRAHLVELEAENERTNTLIRVLARTLGPRVPDCLQCEGCRHEWGEALTLITAHLSENGHG